MASSYQGYGAGYGDPERAKLDRTRRIADALQQGALDTGPKSFWEGAAQLGKAFIARDVAGRADQGEAQYADNKRKAADLLIGQLYPDAKGAASEQLATGGAFDLTPAAMADRQVQGGRADKVRSLAQLLGGDVPAAMQMEGGMQAQADEARRYQDERAYSRSRDTVGDQRWETQFGYQQGRDAVGDAQWSKTFDRQGSQFNTQMGMERQRLAAAAEKEQQPAIDFGDENGLRTQYLGQAKPFIEVRDAYARMKAARPDAAGDLSLIFNYMKMLDPGSTVREGEFANAQNAAGVPTQIANAYNRAMEGERLAPEQRTQFLGQAGGLYQAQEGGYRQSYDFYRDMAGRYGMSPEIIQDMRPASDRVEPIGSDGVPRLLRDPQSGPRFNPALASTGGLQQPAPPTPLSAQQPQRVQNAEGVILELQNGQWVRVN